MDDSDSGGVVQSRTSGRSRKGTASPFGVGGRVGHDDLDLPRRNLAHEGRHAGVDRLELAGGMERPGLEGRRVVDSKVVGLDGAPVRRRPLGPNAPAATRKSSAARGRRASRERLSAVRTAKPSRRGGRLPCDRRNHEALGLERDAPDALLLAGRPARSRKPPASSRRPPPGGTRGSARAARAAAAPPLPRRLLPRAADGSTIVVTSPDDEKQIVVDGDRVFITGDDEDADRIADVDGLDDARRPPVRMRRRNHGGGFIGVPPDRDDARAAPALRRAQGRRHLRRLGRAGRPGSEGRAPGRRHRHEGRRRSHRVERASWSALVRHKKGGETIRSSSCATRRSKRLTVTVAERKDRRDPGRRARPDGAATGTGAGLARLDPGLEPGAGRGPAARDDPPDLEQRLDDLEKKLKDLEGRLPSR